MKSKMQPVLVALTFGAVLIAAPLAAYAATAKVTICHVPPGNPDKELTITIGEPALSAHRAHGDRDGACSTLTNAEKKTSTKSKDKSSDSTSTETWSICSQPSAAVKSDSKKSHEGKTEHVKAYEVQGKLDAGATLGGCTTAASQVCDCSKTPVTTTLTTQSTALTTQIAKDDDDLKVKTASRDKAKADLDKDDADIAKADDDFNKSTGQAKAAAAQAKKDASDRKAEHQKVYDDEDGKVKESEGVKAKHVKDKTDLDDAIKTQKDTESTATGVQGGSCSCPGGKTGTWVNSGTGASSFREILGQ